MPDEIALHREVNRAARAKELAEDEILQEAFKTLEDSYLAAWRGTKTHDVQDREILFIAINALGKVREHLALVIAHGSIAQADLNKLYADAERKKRYGIHR